MIIKSVRKKIKMFGIIINIQIIIIKMNNNISLYIKRAEQHHTKEFIEAAFASNKIGQVRELKFIKKSDTNGREYNGVIVAFEYWKMNIIVKNMNRRILKKKKPLKMTKPIKIKKSKNINKCSL